MDKWVFMKNNESTHCEQVNVGIWNWYHSMYFKTVWDETANITHYHSQYDNSVLIGACKD